MRNGIRQEIVSIAVPVVFGSFLQRITVIVDLVLVGGLGAAAIAAVGITQLMTFVAMTVAWGLSAGTSVVVAQLWGAHRREEAGAVAFHSLLIGALLGMGLSVVGVFMGHAGARFLGAGQDVLPLVGPYLRVVFSFFACSLLVNVLSAVMYGTGDSRPPLRAAVLMNVVHVALAYPLVNGAWGAPHSGVLGAAIATAASETVGALYLLVIGFRRTYLRPDWRPPALMRQVGRVGLPVLGERLLQQAGQLLYLKVVMLYGTAAYAAHQVGMAIEAMAFLPGLGIGMAATTAVGQRLGARQFRQAAIAHQESIRLALIVMVGMGAIFFMLPGPLLRLFTADREVIALGAPLLRIVAILQVPLAIAIVLSGSLRGAGDTPTLFWSTVAGSWGIRVPLAWLFVIVLKLDLLAVWTLLLADWLARMTILAYRYRTDKWHTRCLIPAPADEPGVVLAAVKPG